MAHGKTDGLEVDLMMILTAESRLSIWKNIPDSIFDHETADAQLGRTGLNWR